MKRGKRDAVARASQRIQAERLSQWRKGARGGGGGRAARAPVGRDGGALGEAARSEPEHEGEPGAGGHPGGQHLGGG